ncbi:MAG: diguanylate cyclase [Clostridia bacterium]|nr:diguanylate cyclase [Clostridia bacterium]
MHSIQTKTTLLTVWAIVATMVVATIIGVFAVDNIGKSSSEQILQLLCETGEKNLDSYFKSVEQSVEMVSTYVKADLETSELDELGAHVDRTRAIFAKTANKTNGVLTYYYRIDPSVSDTVKGFWYIDLDGDGFEEHEVTDIAQYDTNDTSKLVWFTVPKATGKPIWLPPYVTDNLDVHVISYNVPIYREDLFIGVVGIEIDYSTMAEQVDNIKLYNNGYAFITDADRNIVYHPHIDVLKLTEDQIPKAPEGFSGDEHFVTYEYQGVQKQAVWMNLSNGMILTVSVPLSEINGQWQHLINEIVIAAVILLVIFIFLTIIFTRHFTKPLRKLTEAADQVNSGNYDINLDYKGNDEMGILTTAVNRLISHLKGYIGDLNSLAYGDALTSVRNKGAFDIHIREIQARVDDANDHPEFAIGIFDCDNLKAINDRYGHDKGDMYLKNSSHLICRVFQHSPVYRIGGDEFAMILQNEDYNNRDELARYFSEKSAEICAFANGEWEKISVAMGIAVYDPNIDTTVEDVIRRADKLMYENKRAKKLN